MKSSILVFVIAVIMTPAIALAAQGIFDDATGGACTNFGTWDVDTKTCTLTADVYDSVFLKADNITLDGNGHTIFRPLGDYGPIGVYVSDRSGVIIKNLIVDSTTSPTIFSGPGILLQNASDNTIENVVVRRSRPGIKFAFASRNNLITGSTITGNRDAGIVCDTGPSGNQIVGNVISGSIQGIIFGSCDHNEIRNNTIGGIATGVRFSGIAGADGSDGNRVLNNNFIENGTQVVVAHSVENVFSEPLPVGGNYWSNYDSLFEGCTDLNNNQICDLPYFFHGGRDDFPWTAQDAWVTPPAEPKTPVIIVPGIMGSRLNRVSDGEEVWPGGIKMLSADDDYLNDLKLKDDGTDISSFEMQASEIVDKELGKVVYGNLIDHFSSLGYQKNTDLFTAPYDWRFDIKKETDRLGEVVNQALTNSPTGKITIIAHSMGGVLVKEYLSQFPEIANNINKIIFAGVPQLGSPKAFKVLNYGDDMNMSKLGLGLNPNKVKEITQNMPGVYQLLPSRKYIDLVGGYIKDFRDGAKILSYDDTAVLMTTDPDLSDYRNLALLNAADTFHQALDRQLVSAPEVHNIVGCQNPETIGHIRLYPDNEIDITAIDGDGTVPLISAMNNAEGFTNYFALHSEIGADHTGLVRDENLVDLIADIVEDNPIALPSGVSRSVADCFEELPDPTKIIFSTHSPVALHIYDESDHHTGPLPNGDIELGIPESNYYTIGGNSFAFVPAGRPYRVAIKATGLGDFDLKIKGYHGSVLGEIVTYLDIPIENINTVAELTFTGFDGPLSLAIDENGDHIPDAETAPSAVLFGEASGDIIPPELTLFSPEPREYLHSDTIPVQFEVSDADSGLAFSKVKLAGEEINSENIDLFFLNLGEHTLSLAAYDRAGNPAVQAVAFTAVTTINDTIADLERAFDLGWIPRKSIYSNIRKDLEKAERIQENLKKLKREAEENSKLLNRVAKTREKFLKILKDFPKKLERHYNDGYVNDEAFDLLQEDVWWLLDNL